MAISLLLHPARKDRDILNLNNGSQHATIPLGMDGILRRNSNENNEEQMALLPRRAGQD